MVHVPQRGGTFRRLQGAPPFKGAPVQHPASIDAESELRRLRSARSREHAVRVRLDPRVHAHTKHGGRLRTCSVCGCFVFEPTEADGPCPGCTHGISPVLLPKRAVPVVRLPRGQR